MPQLSGRGLGHTGGTLDKLEAIPGWRAALSNDEMLAQLESVGAVICAAGDGLAPADKKLYALRDVTGTVEAIPLIASSIMSKKIAEGTGALVLDVKVGTGAFMKDRRRRPRAGRDHGRARHGRRRAHRRPAHRHVDPARPDRGQRDRGRRSRVEVLAGGGPADVVELTLALAREMLAGAGRDDVDPADRLADGSAMDAWRAMIRAQGGDPDAPLPTARESHVVTAPASRHADPARRDGGRAGRVAARRRPGPQGGPGPGRRRRRVARPARRRRHRGRAAAHPAHRRRRTGSSAPSTRSRAAYDVGARRPAYTPAPLVIDRIG